MPTLGGYTREIAIRYKQKKRGRRRSKHLTAVLRKQAVVPIVLIVIGLGGAAFFGLQINKVDKSHKLEPSKTFTSSAPAPAHAPAASPKVLPRSIPTHITIPAVGIDAGVISVGRDASGSIELPPLFDWTTGWYQDSPTPGQLGPAIIVGHVDTYKGISVFWRLRDLQPGNIVEITRADGRVVKFKVTDLKQFDQINFPTKEVYGNIKYAGLRLVTCGGAFNSQTASYTQNTVVYASMVP